MKKDISVGMVVLSVMGRDAGSYYTVIAKRDDEYVYIADGETRTIAKPKLKKIKHLKPNGDILGKIAEKLDANKQVFDSEIRSALRAFNDQIK